MTRRHLLLLTLAVLFLVVMSQISVTISSGYGQGSLSIFAFEHYAYLSAHKISLDKMPPPPRLIHLTRKQFAEMILNSPNENIETGGELILGDDVTMEPPLHLPHAKPNL